MFIRSILSFLALSSTFIAKVSPTRRFSYWSCTLFLSLWEKLNLDVRTFVRHNVLLLLILIQLLHLHQSSLPINRARHVYPLQLFKRTNHYLTHGSVMAASTSDLQGMTLICIHIFIVTGSFLYWCVMRPASQRFFFIHSCIYLRILIISYLATFLVTFLPFCTDEP